MNTPNFLILAIFSCLFLLFSNQINAESVLIKQVCSETTNPSFCTTTLVSNPKSASATDFVALSKAALEIAIASASDSLSYVKDVLAKNTKPEFKKALEICVDGHNHAHNSFRSSYLEIEEDPLTSNYDAKVAGDGYVSCAEALADAKIPGEQISAKNKVGMDIVSIADSVTSKILK